MSTPVFYVYVRHGSRRGFPVGPFTDKKTADRWVDPTRRFAEERIDGYAGFYEWGVAQFSRAQPRPGHLNKHVGYQPDGAAA